MNQITNIDMSEFWNGDGGQNWIRFKNRLEKSLYPIGLHAIDSANFSKGEQILDVGCGWGDTTVAIAKIIGRQGKVRGIDISDLILQQARQRSLDLGFKQLSFDCIDAESQNIGSKEFDVIFSRFGVMFFKNPMKAFKNIRESLKPSGRMIFVCWQSISSNQWVSLPLEIAVKYVSLTSQVNPDAPGGFAFGNAHRVKGIIEQAGFTDVVIRPFSTKFTVGENVEEAVTMLSHLGPASAVLNDPELDSKTRNLITTDLQNILMFYKTTNGIELNAATWVVSARNQK